MFTLFGLKVNAWCFDVGLLLPRTRMVSSFLFRPEFEVPVSEGTGPRRLPKADSVLGKLTKRETRNRH